MRIWIGAAVRHLHLLLWIAAGALGVTARAQSPPQGPIGLYEAIALPLRPAAINEAGEIAGTTPAHRAAIWSRKAGLRLIPLPAGFVHSEAVAINREGHVAGIAYDATFNTYRSFIASGQEVRLLEGAQARVRAIGAGDRAAGESAVAGKTGNAPVVWIRAAAQPLENCCGGSAQAINDAGQVAGDAYDSQGHYHAVLWTEAARMREIGPEHSYSAAIAMNSRGDVIIQALSRVYLFSSTGLVRLPLAPKFPSHARAINDHGVVVGSYGPFSDADRAFLWSPSSGFVDLNRLLAPSAAGWKLESASGINNRGEIVGRGDQQQEDIGFLLVPGG